MSAFHVGIRRFVWWSKYRTCGVYLEEIRGSGVYPSNSQTKVKVDLAKFIVPCVTCVLAKKQKKKLAGAYGFGSMQVVFIQIFTPQEIGSGNLNVNNRVRNTKLELLI